MPSFRLDDHACVYSAPTAIPHESAPTGSVFRGLNDLDLAKAYADQVCAFFAEHGAPAPVFVVRGPTSTTKAKYEVVDATSSYTVEYRVQPPDYSPWHRTFAEVVLASDAEKPLDVQAGLHFTAITEMLNSRSSEELQDLSLERCKAFLGRGVPCMSATHQGRDGAERQILVQFLAFEWPERRIDDIEQLFRGYLRLGALPINGALDDISMAGHSVCAPTALQYAVDNSKTRLVVALLEEGADETLVPKVPVIARPLTGDVIVPAGDFIGYIESNSTSNASELLAGARAALMRRHIAQAASPEFADAAGAHRRARRAVL